MAPRELLAHQLRGIADKLENGRANPGHAKYLEDAIKFLKSLPPTLQEGE